MFMIQLITTIIKSNGSNDNNNKYATMATIKIYTSQNNNDFNLQSFLFIVLRCLLDFFTGGSLPGHSGFSTQISRVRTRRKERWMKKWREMDRKTCTQFLCWLIDGDRYKNIYHREICLRLVVGITWPLVRTRSAPNHNHNNHRRVHSGTRPLQGFNYHSSISLKNK